MKRCPKCNRNFPDDNQKFCTIDGGLLIAADKPFDPNATIQGTTVDLKPPAPPQPSTPPQPNFGETIATPSTAPTVVLPKQTGPTGSPTSANLHQQQQPPPAQSTPATPAPKAPAAPMTSPPVFLPPRSIEPQPQQPGAAVAPASKKRSKLPLVLGIVALLLVLGVVGLVAAFFLIVKPRLDAQRNPPVVVQQRQAENNTNENANNAANTTNTNEETKAAEPEYVPPPNTTKFTNSSAKLDGKLAEHYFDFSFYYPSEWEPDTKAGVAGASNFAKVERRLPPDLTQENFAVGWYTSQGTYAEDKESFPHLVEVLGNSLSSSIPGYKKVSEGPTKINSLDGYEFRFEGLSNTPDKGDIKIWGRVVFLPSGVAGQQAGATLVMLTTSLAPELAGVDDVGSKGEMPVILDSFRFGKPKV